MTRLDEQIATRERRVAEAKAELAELRKEKAKREREARRDEARRARVRERADALELWRWLHEHTVTVRGESMTAYEFVTEHLMPHAKSTTVKEE